MLGEMCDFFGIIRSKRRTFSKDFLHQGDQQSTVLLQDREGTRNNLTGKWDAKRITTAVSFFLSS